MSRKNDKRNRYLREMGRPSMVSDISPALAHLRVLRGAGMSCKQIAGEAGCSENVISQAINGIRSSGHPVTRMRRTTVEAIMAVEVQPIPVFGGAHVSAVGPRRRLQALYAAGFGSTFLSGQLGWGGRRAFVGSFMAGRSGSNYVLASTAKAIRELYGRCSVADPADHGVTVYQTARARNAAKGHGWAPPSCWDSDTIDDPQAIPEWTGRCGSVEGYRIHVRESIPCCPPCRTALNAYQRGRNKSEGGQE